MARTMHEQDPAITCPEAQADGVPCTTVHVACAECERAHAQERPPRQAVPPDKTALDRRVDR